MPFPYGRRRRCIPVPTQQSTNTASLHGNDVTTHAASFSCHDQPGRQNFKATCTLPQDTERRGRS